MFHIFDNAFHSQQLRQIYKMEHRSFGVFVPIVVRSFIHSFRSNKKKNRKAQYEEAFTFHRFCLAVDKRIHTFAYYIT